MSGAVSTTPIPRVAVREVQSADDLGVARRLILEYQRALGVDLEFQGFAHEVAHLPGDYAPPGGVLLLALVDGIPSGCVAVRRLDREICEMKRLFVRPDARGAGAGRALALSAMAHARVLGYTRMRLDTLPSMHAAQDLYVAIGFHEIDPYRVNPVPGTRYLEAAL